MGEGPPAPPSRSPHPAAWHRAKCLPAQAAPTSMPAFYATLDVLVSASRQEGLPIALTRGHGQLSSPSSPLLSAKCQASCTMAKPAYSSPPKTSPAWPWASSPCSKTPPSVRRLGEAARALVADAVLRRPHDRRLPQPLPTSHRRNRKRRAIHEPAATCFHDGPLGHRSLLHRLSLPRAAGRRRPRHDRLHLLLSRYSTVSPAAASSSSPASSISSAACSFRAPPRRILKMAEALLNMAALTLRFLVSPPRRRPRAVSAHAAVAPAARVLVSRLLPRCAEQRSSSPSTTCSRTIPPRATSRPSSASTAASTPSSATRSTSRRASKPSSSVPAAIISIIPHGPFFYDLPIDLPTKTTASTPPADAGRCRPPFSPLARHPLPLQGPRHPARRLATRRIRRSPTPGSSSSEPAHPTSSISSISRSTGSASPTSSSTSASSPPRNSSPFTAPPTSSSTPTAPSPPAERSPPASPWARPSSPATCPSSASCSPIKKTPCSSRRSIPAASPTPSSPCPATPACAPSSPNESPP